MGRRREPSLSNPATHPRSYVCLRVAAEYLQMDERTVRSRIDTGDLPAAVDGKIIRIDVAVLGEYLERRRAS